MQPLVAKVLAVAASVAHVGFIVLGLAAVAAVAVPLGSVVVDYWKPMVVAAKIEPAAATKAKRP